MQLDFRNIEGVPDYSVHVLDIKRAHVALVIPVINEGSRLTSQLSKICSEAFDIDVIIADGGSSDHSTEHQLLSSLNVRALLTKIGSGTLSAQLRMAFHWTHLEGYDFVITMDGNDKDDANGVMSILSALELGFDFVQGSRFIQGGRAINTPKSRLLAIKFLHAPITSLAARFHFTDTTNGFRGFSMKSVIDERVSIFRSEFDSYQLLAYLPVRMSRMGFSVTEVPVTRRYPESGHIPTKIHGLRSHFNLFKILLSASIGMYNPKKDK